jgi:predicted ester cyclase
MSETPFSLPERPAVRRVRPDSGRDIARQARVQPMRGFDPQYTDIVDYIVEITDEIWGQRAIGRIYDTYDANCTIYSSYGVVRSVEQVVANTIGGLNAYPEYDMRHVNVAWSGDEDRGFYTSHLGFARSINLGQSAWGPATGKRTARLFVADCISLENLIHTEWLIHDAVAVSQLGLDMHELARKIAQTLSVDHFAGSPQRPLRGDIQPCFASAEDWAQYFMHSLWTLKRLDRLSEFYAQDAVIHGAGGREAQGLQAIGSLYIHIMAAIPDGVIRVENVCHSDEADGTIVAIRWLMEGLSAPGGAIGDCPRNRPVFMMASTHLRFEDGKIVEQWLVFDELAMLAQTYRE